MRLRLRCMLWGREGFMNDGFRGSRLARRTLAYADGSTAARVRVSRLAVASLVVAVLGSPCLFGRFLSWVNWFVPGDFNQVGRYGFVHSWLIRGGMIVATVLPVVAIVRIRWSRGTRSGAGVAVAGLLVSLLWWGLISVAAAMWRDFRMD